MRKIIGCCIGLLFILWLVTPYQMNAEELSRTDAAISFEEAQIKDKGKLPSTYVPESKVVSNRGVLPSTGELVQSFIILLLGVFGLILFMGIHSMKRIYDLSKGESNI